MPDHTTTPQGGIVRIEMHNIHVATPPADLEVLVRTAYRAMDTPRLLWVLTALVDEIRTRGLDLHVARN